MTASASAMATLARRPIGLPRGPMGLAPRPIGLAPAGGKRSVELLG